MNKIPRIIHQTWKNSNVPSHYIPWIKSWRERHPQWEYKLWTDEMNSEFIRKYAPDFLKIYENYPHAIQRVDAVRYFILYNVGGLFIDMDFECLENIDPLLENQECILGLEPWEHCKQHNKAMILCNAFMASNIGNNFFKTICDELQNDVRVNEENTPQWLKILNSTGPFKLTEIYQNYGGKDQIKLLPSEMIYPFTLQEVRQLIKNTDIDSITQQKIDNAYAVHYFLGSWL